MTAAGFNFLLAPLGPVRAFDYPYQLAGRNRSDPFAQLAASHRAALADFNATDRKSIVLAGKSMGGRVGCHAALEESVAARTASV